MRRAVVASVALALLAWGLPATAADSGAGPPRIHAAQVLLFSATTMAEVEANLVRLKAAGVDTVIVRAFQNRGDRPLLWDGRRVGAGAVGVYFPTTAAPVVAPWIPEVAAACRRLGLSIYAWMTTRACDWITEEHPEYAELRWEPVSGRVLPARNLSIFHPAVRRHLAALWRDLAACDIDGILFQDDLVLRAGEGLSPEAIEAYLDDGGPAVSVDTLFDREARGAGALFALRNYRAAFWPWAAWKNRRLVGLAAELVGEARAVRPELRFAINLYYETALNPRMALAWYAQQLDAAAAGPFDYLSLMSYHRQIGRELRIGEEEARDTIGIISRVAAAAAGDPARVIAKVQALDWEDGRLVPPGELDGALAAPAPGVSLAFVRGAEDPDLAVVRRHFREGP